MYIPVFESFEDNNAKELQPALSGQTAQSRKFVLIWLENPGLRMGGEASPKELTHSHR